MASGRILVGRIIGPHGIRGRVKLESQLERPESIAERGPLMAESGRSLEPFIEAQVGPKVFIARLAGVDDRSAAEALKNTALYLPIEALPAPDPDEFYWAELLGMEAFDGTGHSLGLIARLHDFGAGTILELENGGSSLLLPFTKAVVLSIDREERRIMVDPPAETEDSGEAASR